MLVDLLGYSSAEPEPGPMQGGVLLQEAGARRVRQAGRRGKNQGALLRGVPIMVLSEQRALQLSL